MTIQDWGAIGELVAAVAVVISLAYLAVQIRQNTRQVEDNTRAVRAAAVHSGIQLIFENRVAIFSDAETAAIFQKGLDGPGELSPVDQLRFRLICSNAVDALFNTYSQTEASGFSRDTWRAQVATAKRIITTPGGRWFWESYRNEYRSDFQAEVDAMLRVSG
jgi:hypothetical protein